MTKIIASLLMCLSTLLFSAEISKSNWIYIAKFSENGLSDWQPKIFNEETRYQVVDLDNKKVLQAQSFSSASGLIKKQRIDLRRTPYLNWSWRIENRLSRFNEQEKTGDDYAARIYVVISGGIFFWKTQAINYVWSANSQKGKVWPNAFAGKSAKMIAVRALIDKTGTWYSEKRNILADLKEHFGKTYQYIDAIAIMSDTDNTQTKVTAFYGDIYFSSQ